MFINILLNFFFGFSPRFKKLLLAPFLLVSLLFTFELLKPINAANSQSIEEIIAKNHQPSNVLKTLSQEEKASNNKARVQAIPQLAIALGAAVFGVLFGFLSTGIKNMTSEAKDLYAEEQVKTLDPEKKQSIFEALDIKVDNEPKDGKMYHFLSFLTSTTKLMMIGLFLNHIKGFIK